MNNVSGLIILASAQEYPPLLRAIQISGPLVHGLLALLLGTFLYGLVRAWRHPGFGPLGFMIIYAPTLIGCTLGVMQSKIAQGLVEGSGLMYFRRPDRFIGNIRIYLAVGVLMSVILFVLNLWRSSRPIPDGRDA